MKKIFFMLVSFSLAVGFCGCVANVEAAPPKKAKQRMKRVPALPVVASKNKRKKSIQKPRKVGKKVLAKKSQKVLVKKKNVLQKQKQGKKQVVAQRVSSRVSSLGRGLPLPKNHDAPAALPPVPPKL